MNHKTLTILLILVGIGAFIFNFWLFQRLSFDSTTPEAMENEVKKLSSEVKAAEASKILPDIKASEPIAKSKVRDSEIAKVKPTLPYLDPDYGYAIVYYDKTKTFTVEIPANSLEEYRTKKQNAEAKLVELGSTNLCNLVVFWAPPATLNQELTKDDLVTSNCPS